jgi:acyl carrier protein
MKPSTTVALEDVKAVVIDALGVEERAGTLDADTPLLDSLPELDSMGTLQLVLELEDRFGIVIEGEDLTVDVFGTLASLTAFIDRKRC